MDSALAVLALALATNPGLPPSQRFADEHPSSQRLLSADGQRLVHASDFLADTGARRPEEAARAFLATNGAAFGVTGRQALVVKGVPAVGEVGAVRFERTIDGLPVFGGDLVVGVDAQNRVFVVNGADVPPAISGLHALGEVKARSAAVSSFTGVRGAGPASVATGWKAFGATVRAVYRVDFIAEQPAGDWRVYVDGETGRALFREDRRVYETGNVFELSPMETLAAQCPLSGTAHTACATPITPSLPNLTSAANLTGSQVTAYNCMGADFPTNVPGPNCVQTAAPTSGVYNYLPDAANVSVTDEFAAVMAYYHLDKHYTFLKSLDPGALGGLNYNLPGYVNVYSTASPSSMPLNNAFYSGALKAMVFGQGTAADFAYDAPIVYHEMTHAAVDAWGGFNPNIDALGGLAEPRAVNEGTADALAVSEYGRSQVGLYVAGTGTFGTPKPYLRDLNDPNASRTCQGDGTLVPQLNGAITSLNGLDGEVHDDGEIWNGFYWEVYQGLKAAGVKACSGACDGGPALQYKTLQLAGGTSPTFNSYWQTMTSAATALFPVQSGAAAYVDCVARRRKLDRCDRTFPVYGGESKVQYVDQRFSSFQLVLQATGPPQFSVCSANGTTTTVYVRQGLPVQVTAIDPITGAATVTADGAATFTQPCSGGSAAFGIFSAGTWYLLLDSPSAWQATPDIYRIDVNAVGMTARQAPTTPSTCLPPFLTIAPASSAVPPRGSATFTASGGSGAGYAWSLATNASGGSVTAAGAYTAGPAGSVIDVVQVTDSLGNVATRNVAVTAGVSISPVTAFTPPKGSLTFTASGGSATGFTWSITTNASGGSITTGGAYTGGATGSVTDIVQVTDSLGNTASRSITVTAGVSVTPATASVSTGSNQAFTASGGSGTGFTWSLATNASGASINASTGVYTAGSTSGVTDIVRVTDALGNTATASVTVTTPPPSSTKSGCGCGTSSNDAPILAVMLATLLWRPRKHAGKA